MRGGEFEQKPHQGADRKQRADHAYRLVIVGAANRLILLALPMGFEPMYRP